MSQDELIDSHISERQCKLAVEALHKHEAKKEEERQEHELLPGKEQNVWLVVTVKKITAGHKVKPVKIPIVHPLIDPRTTPICLITKDPQRQYKDLLESHGIKFISRVVGILKLKGKFKPFEARRMLLKENGMFLADERVIPLLPKLLGSKWFEAKKQPVPVCLTRKDLKGELERAVSSTYMNQNQGTCTSIKIGTLSHTPAQILANLKKALPVIIKNIQGGWDNVQSFNIKTNSSVSLPIWTCSLDEGEGGRWNGLSVAPDQEMKESDEEEQEEDAEIELHKTQEKKDGKGNQKKRSPEDLGMEKPKKKTKGSEGQVVQASTSKTPNPKFSGGSPQEGKLATATTDVPAKSKKRKATAPESASTPAAFSQVLESTKSPVTNSAEPAMSKKRAHKSQSSVEITPPAPEPTTPSQSSAKSGMAADVPSTTKKTKKSRASEVLEHPTASSTAILPPSAATSTAGQHNKKKKARPSAAEPLAPVAASGASVVDAATPSVKNAKLKKNQATDSAPSTPAPVAASKVLAAPGSKSKDSKTMASPVLKSTIKAVPVSVSKEYLKQKRITVTGEKKKDKVVKAKGARSAKDTIIGKKAAQ